MKHTLCIDFIDGSTKVKTVDFDPEKELSLINFEDERQIKRIQSLVGTTKYEKEA